MEAKATTPSPAPAIAAPSRSPLDVVRAFAGRYGLVLVLLALPVYYGIQDLSEEGDLSHLANNLFSGLSNGTIIALVAVGHTLVYGIIELINFAHGDVFIVGSFTA